MATIEGINVILNDIEENIKEIKENKNNLSEFRVNLMLSHLEEEKKKYQNYITMLETKK